MYYSPDDPPIGRRIREVRTWRGLSLKATAELAGISEGHLSRIERGQRGVHRRAVLESLASALRVAPSELAAQAVPPAGSDPLTVEAQAAVIALESALSEHELGEAERDESRPWPAVVADLQRLNDDLRPNADYAAQGVLLPELLADLHALYVSDPQRRREVLQAMLSCYQAAAATLKNLGVRGLPTLAAFHAQKVAEELEDPAWLGVAAWLRAYTLGGVSRARVLDMSLRAADDLRPHLGDDRALQVYGFLHLNAALACAALERGDSEAHLDEAGKVAERTGPQGHGFAQLSFGPDNVGIWRLAISVELGEVGQARKVAGTVDPAAVPSPTRQAMYWADLGRALAQDRATRGDAVAALLRAEQLAPQRIQANAFVRETVGDLVRVARREAVGRELRGMAYRMGLGAA